MSRQRNTQVVKRCCTRCGRAMSKSATVVLNGLMVCRRCAGIEETPRRGRPRRAARPPRARRRLPLTPLERLERDAVAARVRRAEEEREDAVAALMRLQSLWAGAPRRTVRGRRLCRVCRRFRPAREVRRGVCDGCVLVLPEVTAQQRDLRRAESEEQAEALREMRRDRLTRRERRRSDRLAALPADRVCRECATPHTVSSSRKWVLPPAAPRPMCLAAYRRLAREASHQEVT